MLETNHNHQKWTFDRKIPFLAFLAFVITMLTQIFLVTWWIAKLDSRVQHLEIKAERGEKHFDALLTQVNRIAEHVARIDERTRRP